MKSSVAETFRDGTVFVTGSTGFLGKLLTEKLLRSCPVKNVAILVRSKKGFTASQRVEDMYNQPVCTLANRVITRANSVSNSIQMLCFFIVCVFNFFVSSRTRLLHLL